MKGSGAPADAARATRRRPPGLQPQHDSPAPAIRSLAEGNPEWTRAPPTAAITWTGRILSGLVVAFVALDDVMKIVVAAPVVVASEKLGIPLDAVVGIGVTLLACTAVYAVPRTAVLGAVLLTGYLGGATATHVLARGGAFPVGFAVAFGVLVWVGLVLREPRLLWVILRRK